MALFQKPIDFESKDVKRGGIPQDLFKTSSSSKKAILERPIGIERSYSVIFTLFIMPVWIIWQAVVVFCHRPAYGK